MHTREVVDRCAPQEWSQKQAQRAAVRARAKAGGGRGATDRRFLEPEVLVIVNRRPSVSHCKSCYTPTPTADAVSGQTPNPVPNRVRRLLLPQVEVQLGTAEDEADTAVTERRAVVPWLTADGVGTDPYGASPAYYRQSAAKADLLTRVV